MGNGSCWLAHAHCTEGGFEVDQQQERWRHFRANPAHKMVVRDLLTLCGPHSSTQSLLQCLQTVVQHRLKGRKSTHGRNPALMRTPSGSESPSPRPDLPVNP